MINIDRYRREVPTCEELDAIHMGTLQYILEVCGGRFDRDRSPTYNEQTMYGIGKMMVFSQLLQAVLVGEGLDTSYTSDDCEWRQTVWVRCGNGMNHIVITTHLYHNTLLYYNGPPHMGTIRELVGRVHKTRKKQEAREYCWSCHYINRDLGICGQGLELVEGCIQYRVGVGH